MSRLVNDQSKRLSPSGRRAGYKTSPWRRNPMEDTLVVESQCWENPQCSLYFTSGLLALWKLVKFW